jgi:hypothetical protein
MTGTSSLVSEEVLKTQHLPSTGRQGMPPDGTFSHSHFAIACMQLVFMLKDPLSSSNGSQDTVKGCLNLQGATAGWGYSDSGRFCTLMNNASSLASKMVGKGYGMVVERDLRSNLCQSMTALVAAP